MKVALALHPRWNIDSDALDGATRVAIYDMKLFNQRNVETSLYGNVSVPYKRIQRSIHIEAFGKKDPFYYSLFYLKNRGADVFIGVSFPELGLFSPSKTITHYQEFGGVNLLPYYKFFKDRYHKNRFIFCSDFLRKSFQKSYPEIPSKNCHTIYNAVDVGVFTPFKKNGSDGSDRILFSGQWCHEKGLYIFFKAIKRLNAKRNDFKAFIAGGPYIWQSKKFQEWSRRQDRLSHNIISKLDNTVELGPIPHRDMPRIYNTSDIFVFPSTWQEPFGMSLAEAMACELPCVASRVGGVPEIISQDRREGVLVGPGDPKVLAGEIEYLLDNEDERHKIGKAARARIVDNFTWKRHVDEYLPLLSEIAG